LGGRFGGPADALARLSVSVTRLAPGAVRPARSQGARPCPARRRPADDAEL
jgi:hypothetical protein